MESLAKRRRELEDELRAVDEQLREMSGVQTTPRGRLRERGRQSALWHLLTKWQGHLFSGQSLESLFNSVDKDGSGFIDRDEVCQVSRRLGMVLKEGAPEGWEDRKETIGCGRGLGVSERARMPRGRAGPKERERN